MKIRLSLFFKFFLILIGFSIFNFGNAKKIKQSFKITREKEKKSKSGTDIFPGSEIILNASTLQNDSTNIGEWENISSINFTHETIRFSGYEKEVNSNKETFLITNKSPLPIIRIKFEIIYKDKSNRMLHSREITKECNIPSQETRKIDIPSWDSQHTYYYYLGNQPKKIATPYKVEIIPLSIWIE